MRKTQDIRDTLRRGSHAGVALNDRPADLERYSPEVASYLLDEHIVLGNMLNDGEPMFIRARGATTAANWATDSDAGFSGGVFTDRGLK